MYVILQLHVYNVYIFVLYWGGAVRRVSDDAKAVGRALTKVTCTAVVVDSSGSRC